MTTPSSEEPGKPMSIDAGRALDRLREIPESDDARRSEALDTLIGRFPAEALSDAVRQRLGNLQESDGETLIALVEGLARPELLDALAEALVDQESLPPDLLWLALEVLEGSGRIESRPSLVQRRDELDDLIGGDDPMAELASQIADDPESVSLAIEALSQIEPQVRADIIAGLGHEAGVDSVLRLLQQLALSADEITRNAAREAIRQAGTDSSGGLPSLVTPSAFDRPVIERSAVGPLDGEGRGVIVIASNRTAGRTLARFVCDVREGIVQGEYDKAPTSAESDSRFIAAVEAMGVDVAIDRHPIATLLLGAAAWLSGDRIDEQTRGTLVRTLGDRFDCRPIFADTTATGRTGGGKDVDLIDASGLILARREDWRDRSSLVRELAVAWALREGELPPDAIRDPGPFRVLFEERVLGRIDLYRRMLLWTALVWESNGEVELASHALKLAAQLGDPQNAVPGHPFLAELMARSLADSARSQAI